MQISPINGSIWALVLVQFCIALSLRSSGLYVDLKDFNNAFLLIKVLIWHLTKRMLFFQEILFRRFTSRMRCRDWTDWTPAPPVCVDEWGRSFIWTLRTGIELRYYRRTLQLNNATVWSPSAAFPCLESDKKREACIFYLE